MTKTIKRLCESVIDLAGKIGAEDIGQDGGVSVAEAVIFLRDGQRAMNGAIEALRLAKAQAADGKPNQD